MGFFRFFKKGDSSRSLVSSLKEKYGDFVEGANEVGQKLKDLPATNMQLGLEHLYRGNYVDASLRFGMVSRFTDNNAEAYYNCARSQLFSGEIKKAGQFLAKALLIDKNVDPDGYLSNRLNRPEVIKIIPKQFIEQRGDAFSPYHHEWYKNKSSREYFSKESLVKVVMANCRQLLNDGRILDLGCSVGTYGKILKENSIRGQIVGVDSSEKMLEYAKEVMVDEKPAYSDLIKSNLVDFLLKSGNNFSVIIISDVFKYYMDIKPVVEAVKNAAADEAMIVFLYNDLSGDESHLSGGNDMFVHPISYIENSLRKEKFEKMKESRVGGEESKEFVLLYKAPKKASANGKVTEKKAPKTRARKPKEGAVAAKKKAVPARKATKARAVKPKKGSPKK